MSVYLAIDNLANICTILGFFIALYKTLGE